MLQTVVVAWSSTSGRTYTTSRCCLSCGLEPWALVSCGLERALPRYFIIIILIFIGPDHHDHWAGCRTEPLALPRCFPLQHRNRGSGFPVAFTFTIGGFVFTIGGFIALDASARCTASPVRRRPAPPRSLNDIFRRRNVAETLVLRVASCSMSHFS